METTDISRRKEIIELEHHRNPELKELIDKTFGTKSERDIAWRVVFLIKGLYPEFGKTWKMIHKQIEEI